MHILTQGILEDDQDLEQLLIQHNAPDALVRDIGEILERNAADAREYAKANKNFTFEGCTHSDATKEKIRKAKLGNTHVGRPNNYDQCGSNGHNWKGKAAKEKTLYYRDYMAE